MGIDLQPQADSQTVWSNTTYTSQSKFLTNQDLNVSLTSIPNQARCNSSCPDAILVKLLAVLTTANDPIPPQIGYYAVCGVTKRLEATQLQSGNLMNCVSITAIPT
eukprot:scaffold154763_cov23-Tisochrysis_lutea.AAC.1